MLLLDFRNWNIKKLGMLPNAQKALFEKDFEELKRLLNVSVLGQKTGKHLSLSSLFFENLDTIAVSAIKNIEPFYSLIDETLELKNKEVIDYTEAAEEEVFFYGSESLVANLSSEIAIAGINNYTDESLFEEYCEDFELTPFSFDLPEGLFTREVACFIDTTLLICLDYISDKKLKKSLFTNLKNNGIEIITVTKEQVEKGILNFVFTDGIVVMPKSVKKVFKDEQLDKLSKFKIKEMELSFLDTAGVKLRDVII